jgi:hypothetical protein
MLQRTRLDLTAAAKYDGRACSFLWTTDALCSMLVALFSSVKRAEFWRNGGHIRLKAHSASVDEVDSMRLHVKKRALPGFYER